MPDAQTLTLTDFLLARIAEDEGEARKASADRQRYLDEGVWVPGRGHTPPETFLQAWEDHPGPLVIVGIERVLAECEAKRRIVELDSSQPDPILGDDILKALALPYADHPDYRDEWRVG